MKKVLLLVLFILFPVIVSADETCSGESPKDWCVGYSCLSGLQSTYNTWSSNGNTGKACIKVIAQRNGNTQTYLSGKNPNTDYKCANGNIPTIELRATALSIENKNVSECENDTCYVPELWAVDCGDATNTNSSIENANNGSNNIIDSSGTNSDNANNVQTNSSGQITGTTDTSDTGVETYFIVLITMIILAYATLLVVNKKNIFKNI